MITALASSVIGLAGGLIPDIFSEFKAGREHKRELEAMDKQAELQIRLVEANTDAKLAEIEGNVVVEEMKSFAKQMVAIYETQKPIGVKWVDAWNSALRPLAATLITILFVATAGMYIVAILQQFGSGIVDLAEAATLIWGSLIGEAIQAVLGFLFGYRCSAGRVRQLRGPK